MAAIRERWRDWAMLLFGAWLVISPFVLGYRAEAPAMAVWNPVIIGLAVIVFAVAVLTRPQQWEAWVMLILGAWLVLAPFVLGFAGIAAALWNHVILGLLVAADAGYALYQMREGGGTAHTA